MMPTMWAMGTKRALQTTQPVQPVQRSTTQLQLKAAGFTLMELMVAVTIIAIISAIAIPIYTQFSERSYRTEAQADLMNCAQGLERWSAINFTYLGAADEDADGDSDGVASASDEGPLGTQICQPISVAQGRYAITIDAAATTFTLTADPVDPGPMSDDGEMTIDEAGNRQWNEDNAGGFGAGEDDWIEG